jgi:hypothetical protein
MCVAHVEMRGEAIHVALQRINAIDVVIARIRVERARNLCFPIMLDQNSLGSRHRQPADSAKITIPVSFLI